MIQYVGLEGIYLYLIHQYVFIVKVYKHLKLKVVW